MARRCLNGIAVIALLLGPCVAAAQAWPARPVRVVVPFPPGGAVDITTRMVSEKMAAALGQPFVVENRAGAGGLIGAEQVAKAAPDGYAIVMATVSTQAIAPAVYRKMPYDPIADFTPISLTALTPYVVAVHPSVPAQNLRELIELARSRPGTLNFGSTGTGTTPHLAGELFATMAGVQLNHVPYKGSAPMLTDLLGNQVQLTFDNSVIPHIRSGKLRGLAVTAMTRLAAVPNIPTANEAGLAGYEAVGWIGFFGPKGLPTDIVDRLARENARALDQPEVRERLTGMGLQGTTNTPAQFGEYLKAEITKWARVVRDAKVPQQ